MVYGLERTPKTQIYTVEGEEVRQEVSTDYNSDVYYERDMMRLQARKIGMDFCSPYDLVVSWEF